jgi:HPt (histidine-containing phosphotransfer) domain-containing protein
MNNDTVTVDPSLPLFDEAAAMERVNNDAEFLAELLGIFLEACPAQRAALASAVAQADPVGLTHAAHALKGALLSVGAVRPARHVQALEVLGRSGSTDGARAELDRLDALMTALEAVLQGWRTRQAA